MTEIDINIVDLIKKRGRLKVAVLRDHGLNDKEIDLYKNNSAVSVAGLRFAHEAWMRTSVRECHTRPNPVHLIVQVRT